MTDFAPQRVHAPKRRGGLADDVAIYVRELILTGQLEPGSRVDQDAIGDAMGVSRSPVREAIVVLGQEGLLEVLPRRGAIVAHLTREDVIDHYELFGLISGRAASAAAIGLSDKERHDLQAIHDRFEVAAPSELSALNRDFHRLITRAAPSRTRWLLV
ncbi:MAG: GntR family transcriptional regulator, partial [Acidimicrobiales bacterium]